MHKFFNRKIFSVYLKPLLIFCTAVCLAASSATCVFASGHWEERTVSETLDVVKCTMEIDMWHYSGGYWKAGMNGESFSESMELTDAELDGAFGIGDYISSNKYALFEIDIPDKYNKPGWDFAMNFSANFFDRFNTSTASARFSDGKILLYACPVLHFSTYCFDDFFSNLLVSIPLLDITYGQNLYAVWKGATEMGRGYGYFNEAKINSVMTSLIHPWMIKDYTGKFQNGYRINFDGKYDQSDAYSVGYGTFQKAGAVGLYLPYSFSVQLTAYKTESYWVEDPYVPPVSPPDNPYVPPEEPVNPETPSEPNPGDPTSPGAVSTDDWRIHRVS